MTDESEIAVLARASGLGALPAVCHDGVLANLELLRHYAALIEGLELPDRLEPAFEYTP